MFTRLSNFTYGNYAIANIQVNSVDDDLSLKIQIQKYEQQCLRLLLGDTTYEAFMDEVELDSDGYYKLKSTAPEKWGWLVNGKLYDNRKWSGLVKKVAVIQDKDILETLMAPYIFYYWSLNTRTLNLGTGEGRLDSKSSTQESSKNKRIDAWNEFVQWASFGYSCTNVSLNSFLCSHPDDFPEANLVTLNPLNYYDL